MGFALVGLVVLAILSTFALLSAHPSLHRLTPSPSPSLASLLASPSPSSSSLDINMSSKTAAGVDVKAEERKKEGLVKLLPLPWSYDALSPYMSSVQVHAHYDLHHAGYVRDLNALGQADPSLGILGHSLEHLIRSLKPGKPLNFASQIWNHSFFWRSLCSPKHAGENVPHGAIHEAIKRDFGSFEEFKGEFTKVAVGHFASGWCWLVQGDDGKLHIVDTHDGGNVIREGKGKPLLNLDLWEHAYYLDWKAERLDYVKNYWPLVDWDFANRNLAAKCVQQDGPACDEQDNPMAKTADLAGL